MSEELLQRNLIEHPEKIGNWDFYNIGATTVTALKEYKIIRGVDYGSVENKKVDALIVCKKDVIAVIEYKKPSQFKTEAQKDKAVKQQIETVKKLRAKILIATDTQEAVWINVLTGDRIKNENGKEIKTVFNPNDEKLSALIKKIYDSIDEKNNNIKPKQLIKPTNLAKSIWQDIWAVSGATPENCLYTFVELFIFKYLSDLNVLEYPQNFDYLIELYDKRDKEFVLEYYANNVRPKIKDLFPENSIDKTTVINGTIFVSKDQKAVNGYSSTFKTVLSKFNKYEKLENIDYDFKSHLFESFLKESISKKNWGQFFTPLKVVRSIVEMAKDDIKEGIKICDPACGVGKFLLEPIAARLENFYKINKKGITPKITLCGFDKGFDKEEQKTIILAKANMLIYFSDIIKDNPKQTKNFAELFNNSFTLQTNSILGTLSLPIKNEYDLILTNPPYVTSGSGNLKEEIKSNGVLTDYYKINAMGVEGLFTEWIIRALKPGGKAFVVIPDGILNRQNDKNLRQFILDECYIDGIISLPVKTFFTTSKKTYILSVTKKINKKDIQKDPVFTYLVSEIGESRDIYRFDIERDDLKEAVNLYFFFKGNKKGFEKINSDKRCKIQPIDFLVGNVNNHWSVDRWWTKKEKIELGILEKDNIVNIIELGELVEDIAESLKNFSQVFKEFNEGKKNSYIKIQLNDKKYFNLFIGKRLVKKDIIKMNGNIPIYSANVFKPVGYHTKSNIDNFDNHFIIWGIDGDFEFNCIEKNNPFVTTDHCGAIRIMTDEILPEYLMLRLAKVKHKYGFDRGLRASLKNMKQVSVPLPIDSSGNIDIRTQQDVIAKYRIIKEIKEKVKDYKNKITNLNIEIQSDCNNNNLIKINDIFNFQRGKVVSKKYIQKNEGKYPIYSSNTLNNGVLGHINSYDFDCKGITWTTDGIYAGTTFYREGKFSITNVCGLITVKKEYEDRIYLPYIQKILNFRKIATGTDNKKVMTNVILKSDIEILIPVDENGEFDLQKQKEIDEKYSKIEEIKRNIKTELEKIENIKVDIGL